MSSAAQEQATLKELLTLCKDSRLIISEVDKTAFDIFLNPNDNLKSVNFFGRAFYKKSNGLLIITFGGLKGYQDILLQATTIFLKQLPQKYGNAELFYQQVMAKANKLGIPKSKIMITGHSLGAFVGELLGVNYKIHTVTFDGPGTRHHLKTFFGYSDQYLDNVDVTVYLSMINPINTHLQQIGKVQQIKIDYSKINYQQLSKTTLTPLRLYFTLSNQMHQIAEGFLPQLIGDNQFLIDNTVTYNSRPLGGFNVFFCNFLDYNYLKGFWDNIIKLSFQTSNQMLGVKSYQVYQQLYLKFLAFYKSKGCSNKDISSFPSGDGWNFIQFMKEKRLK